MIGALVDVHSLTMISEVQSYINSRLSFYESID